MRRLLSAILAIAVCAAAPAMAQAVWSHDDARELLSVVEGIGAEGLDPADYSASALRGQLDRPRGAWDSLADTTFLRLSSDLAQGHVRARTEAVWYIPGGNLSETGRLELMQTALSRHAVRRTLLALLPQDPQYRALKMALAATPRERTADIRRLRANLERWRWMPRAIGNRYLFVNVPAFTVSLIDGGRVVSVRRVIVGKPATPTPQFSALVTGAIFNPWWDVPDSIVRESIGRLMRAQPALARQRGYVVQGGHIRQRPGPANALGQVKLVMPNPYRVYLHDTPTRTLFDAPSRAFSHGCIRTQDPLGLVRELLEGNAQWSSDRIDRTLAEGVTTQADLDRPIPVYVAYFTAFADDRGVVSTYPDIYGRDPAVIAALIDREGG
jgi:murein L,D-transpeptidase YcbB/YkuD